MADKALTKKMIDGVGLVESTDEGHQVIDSLIKKLGDANTALSAKDGEIAALTATHTTALAAKDAELVEAKKLGDTAALDARVAARTQLVTDARKIGGAELVVDGKSDAEIRQAAVTAHLGDEAVKGRDAAFLDAAFTGLVLAHDKANPGGAQVDSRDGLRDAFQPNRETSTNDRAAATSYEDRMAGKYKAA